MQYIVSPAETGQRLDIFCVSRLPQFSRAALQKAIKAGQILVNQEPSKPRYLLKTGDTISTELAVPAAVLPESPIPTIPILYEDKDVVVINKPAGVEAHPGQLPGQPTVAEWFLKHSPTSAKVGESPERAGIVHRLDKDTSGVMILAKNEPTYQHLKRQFQDRRAKKEYVALVFGIPTMSEGRITRPLARSPRNPLRRTVVSETAPEHEALRGKHAVTEWKIEQKYPDRFALLRLFPLTGRTHQLRAHLHFLGYPIVGDNLYTFKRQRPPKGVVRQLLHAEKLTVTLPGGKKRTFVAELPPDFQNVLNEL